MLFLFFINLYSPLAAQNINDVYLCLFRSYMVVIPTPYSLERCFTLTLLSSFSNSLFFCATDKHKYFLFLLLLSIGASGAFLKFPTPQSKKQLCTYMLAPYGASWETCCWHVWHAHVQFCYPLWICRGESSMLKNTWRGLGRSFSSCGRWINCVLCTCV